MSRTICPKCQYQRLPSDRHVHEGVCPRCGIAYAKHTLKHKSPAVAEPRSRPRRAHQRHELTDRVLRLITQVPEETRQGVFWGQAGLLAGLVLWGVSFMLGGIDWKAINSSFMHLINLPFHEFGHVLFMPFGRFMAILGGSLFQVVLPLLLLGVFVIKQKDNFAASICLWWCGQSFIDVSPYIADAPYRSMPLIGGMGESAHDWGNLLTMLDMMSSAQSLASISFGTGCVLMVLSWCWGGYLLLLMRKKLV
ncbi:MAG: hypothetical protein KDI36_04940 [Pseudomonadales bacterium]|nr:hypothetical protein [Pseudomonadales bacterium]